MRQRLSRGGRSSAFSSESYIALTVAVDCSYELPLLPPSLVAGAILSGFGIRRVRVCGKKASPVELCSASRWRQPNSLPTLNQSSRKCVTTAIYGMYTWAQRLVHTSDELRSATMRSFLKTEPYTPPPWSSNLSNVRQNATADDLFAKLIADTQRTRDIGIATDAHSQMGLA